MVHCGNATQLQMDPHTQALFFSLSMSYDVGIRSIKKLNHLLVFFFANFLASYRAKKIGNYKTVDKEINFSIPNLVH